MTDRVEQVIERLRSVRDLINEWQMGEVVDAANDAADLLEAPTPPMYADCDTYVAGQYVFNYLHAFLNAAGIDAKTCKLVIELPDRETQHQLVSVLQREAKGPPRSAARIGNHSGKWQGIDYEFALASPNLNGIEPTEATPAMLAAAHDACKASDLLTADELFAIYLAMESQPSMTDNVSSEDAECVNSDFERGVLSAATWLRMNMTKFGAHNLSSATAAMIAELTTANTLDRKPDDVLLLEICRGQAGDAVYLNDHRLAGPRHNGLMKTVQSWKIKGSDVLEAIGRAVR